MEVQYPNSLYHAFTQIFILLQTKQRYVNLYTVVVESKNGRLQEKPNVSRKIRVPLL